MKKKHLVIIIVIMAAIIVCLLAVDSVNSIDRLSNLNYYNTETIEIDEILKAIENKDAETLKSMFAESVVSEADRLDEDIEKLFEYYQGETVSCNDWGGDIVSEDIDYGYRTKTVEGTYDIKTSEARYEMSILKCTADNDDSSQIGIYSIYIINYDLYEDKGFAYWGDGKNTIGINFDINQ